MFSVTRTRHDDIRATRVESSAESLLAGTYPSAFLPTRAHFNLIGYYYIRLHRASSSPWRQIMYYSILVQIAFDAIEGEFNYFDLIYEKKLFDAIRNAEIVPCMCHIPFPSTNADLLSPRLVDVVLFSFHEMEFMSIFLLGSAVKSKSNVRTRQNINLSRERKSCSAQKGPATADLCIA